MFVCSLDMVLTNIAKIKRHLHDLKVSPYSHMWNFDLILSPVASDIVTNIEMGYTAWLLFSKKHGIINRTLKPLIEAGANASKLSTIQYI